MFFFDDHIGWVIGWPGVCLHTKNGGLTWTTQTTGTYNELYGVYFVNSNIGWIVAQYGEILHTTNGGETWKFQYSGTDKDLNKVYFANRNYGMIISDEGLILTTIDGGQKWEVQESGTNNDLYDFALSPEGMVAVGKGGITMRYTVEDEDLPVDLPPKAEEVETLVASGQLSMEVVAYEWEIVRHTNWQTDFADVFFVDSQLGWVVGSNGKISHTVNSGQTWMPQRSPEKTDLKTVFFTDKDHGWVLGRATLLRTENGG